MSVKSGIKKAISSSAQKGKKAGGRVAQKIGVSTRNKVKKAQVRVAKVRRSIDDVLIDSKSLSKIRSQILEKKKVFEKESELATQLALQILDRAKSIRKKLNRKSSTKNHSELH